jgi:iron complex outermembrane receptor protein
MALATTFMTQVAYAQSKEETRKPSWAGDDIVVTGEKERYTASDGSSATRTSTPLLQVPQSVQVLTSALLKEQDRRSLTDALVNVSGVLPTRPEETQQVTPLIRGFVADIFLDGLPAFGTNAAIDPTSLVGVERIEVVKGPTSTVYAGGAGAPIGGLINVVSAKPDDRLGGFVAVRGGSYSTFDPYADLNVPLTGNIYARVNGEYQSNGNWVDKVKGERWSVQPSILFKLGARTELVIRGKYDERSQVGYSGLPAAQALAGLVYRYAFPGATSGQPRSFVKNRLIGAELRHDFTDDLRLTVTGRYFNSDAGDVGSFFYPAVQAPNPTTPTVYPIFTLYLPRHTKESTIDANLLANFNALGGRHALLVGVDYDVTDLTAGVAANFNSIGSIDLANPNYNLVFGALPNVNPSLPKHYETIAGYVQDQISFGPLHLSGSLRFIRLNLRQPAQKYDLTYNRVVPRVGATLDIAPGAALFAGFATGFRGEYGYNGKTPPKPETSRSIEAGLKLALPKAKLSGTIAAFQLQRRNVPVADPANVGFSIQTGEQRSRGIEADLTWEPVPAFSLLANYAYTDATVTEDTRIPIGDRLARVPKHAGRVAARYRLLNGPAKGFAFGAGLTAFTSRALTLPNTLSVPGYAVMDAQASYDIGKFTIGVSVVNLGDRKAFDTFQYLGVPVVIPIQPRSAYVTLKAAF